MFIVEVKPDWNLAPIDPGSENWMPAMPAGVTTNREADSTFANYDTALVFSKSLQALSGTLGATYIGTDYVMRIRELT